MDSASSSLPFASRDGLSPAAVGTVEDEVALPVAVRLAKEAALLFHAGKLDDCLGILNQILQKKDDPKVRHNILIAKNVGDGGSDPKKLIEELENIKKQSEKLADVHGEHSDVSNDGEKSMVGMKGTNNAVHEFSDSSVVYGNEFDTSVAMYNIAVVWFHLHEYEKSFSYLDVLYQNIEPVDEGTALRICLLLVDVALLSHHASRSSDVISYMEKVFLVNNLTNHVDNGPSTQLQPLSVSKPVSVSSNSTLPDSSHADSVATANTLLENSLTRTSSEEALEDESLQLLSSLDISRKNLLRPGIATSNDLSRNQAEESLLTDLRLNLHLFKVRLLLLTRNLKAAKREVKVAMNLARGKDSPIALYLKSQLEYARRNYRKAIKLLMASSNCMDTSFCSMYYNNLGCIYHEIGKHHTAGVFFSKAIKSSSHARKEKPPKLLTLLQDKSLLISYNCGIHSLACGKPFHAAKCFLKASQIFYNRPLLWLRIAECCLMAFEKGLLKSNCSAFDRYDIRANVIGKGKWRHLALKYGMSPNGQCEYTEKDHLFLGDGKQPDLSMSLARQCLVNALYLLDSSEAKYFRSGSSPVTEENESREKILSADHKPVLGDSKESNLASNALQPDSNGEVKEQKGVSNQNASLQNSIPEHEYNCMRENQMIRQAILTDLAYVELALGNPLKALSVAKSLLKLPDSLRIYLFLGTMYIAEALCMLNQPKEAAEHLMKYVSGGNVELPYSREDLEKWKVQKVADNEDSNVGTVATSADGSQAYTLSSPEVARGIFCANYAVNLALLGDLQRAHHFVTKALSDIPNSPQAVVTAIYLDLKHGETREALAKLKQLSAARFLSGNLMSNGAS